MILRCERCGATFDHRETHKCKACDTQGMVDTPLVDTPKTPLVDTPKGSRHGVYKDPEARKMQMREAARARRAKKVKQ